MRRPGERLRSLAASLCSPLTMERLIDPVIADMQCEHDAALREGGRARRLQVIVAGHFAFWKVLVFHAPTCVTRNLTEGLASGERPIGRALVCAAFAMLILTAALTVRPLLGILVKFHGAQAAWLFVLLLPQAIPLTLPAGLLLGVSFGLHNRTVTARVRHAVLVVGFAGSLATFGTMVWLIPTANQAFRVTVARDHIVEGPAELSMFALRERAASLQARGLPRSAGRLLLTYHARLALVPAALIFSLFALDIVRLRAGSLLTFAFATIPFAVYGTWLFSLSTLEASAFSHEATAVTAVWVPNLILGLAMLAFAAARRRRALPA